MKSTIIIFLVMLTCGYVHSQIRSVDPSLRNKLATNKVKLYEKMVQVEEQITPNQTMYDVIYYSLNFEPNPETSVLTGRAEIAARVRNNDLDHIELNFWSGMNILDIHMSDSPNTHLYFTHDDDILYISLDKLYQQGEDFRVTIEYNGQPQNSPYQSFDFGVKDNKPMIWTLSQPYGARAWWPCKDIPSDKADSVDIRVTVPNDLIVASNGFLKETTINGDQTTYWWHEQYPISSYLISLAIHSYVVSYDDYLYNDNTESMKIYFYMFPENADQFASLNARTKEMITFFSEMFGQYPFIKEKYAHADFLGGGAMEHQTCSSFSFWNEWVVAHELAHQWWGNLITCEDFHHIWLNEGFATYSEALWYEYLNGPGTASNYQITTNLYLGGGTIYVEDPQNDNIFDTGLSYSKGSWVLHMLRHVVGDETFFNILKTYDASESHRFSTATTEEFQSICEQVSGLKLDKFFYQWIYEEYYPRYKTNWTWSQEGQSFIVQLDITQEQENHLYWMPIDVTITTSDHEITFVVWDSLKSQTFNFELNSEPLSVEIDKYNWILKHVEEKIIDPTFDQGILMVNGVNFDVYDNSIRAAYESKAYWGDFPITFWDCFTPPEDDYPSTLPEPLGHGRVPAYILDNYSSVIWIGNNYQGDISAWFQTSILQYLEAGGNLYLITRHGQEFIDEDKRDYLGISWAENTTNILANCVSDFEGLVNMSFTDIQSSNAVFDTKFYDEQSTLLFKETASFTEDRALGVWKKPVSGGTYRPQGGQFVFISGRPYRFINQDLRQNSEYILEHFFGESKTLDIETEIHAAHIKKYVLYKNYPNPFNPKTIINYKLPITNDVELEIYNVLGQHVATLVSERQVPGFYQVEWNGSEYPSGIYYYRIKAGTFKETVKMILLK